VVSFDQGGGDGEGRVRGGGGGQVAGEGAGVMALTHRLIGAALKRGVRIFTGVVLFENRSMLNLLRDLGLPETLRYEEGIEHVEIELERPGQ
jgi:hypothetical protein